MGGNVRVTSAKRSISACAARLNGGHLRSGQRLGALIAGQQGAEPVAEARMGQDRRRPVRRPEPALCPLQRYDEHTEQRPALLCEPISVVRYDKHTVGGEDRQPIRDRTRRSAELVLKVGESAYADERRDQQRETPA